MQQSILFPYQDNYFDTVGKNYNLTSFIESITKISRSIADNQSKNMREQIMKWLN